MRRILLGMVLVVAGAILAADPAPEAPAPAPEAPAEKAPPAPAGKEPPDHAFYREKACLECHSLSQKDSNPKGSPFWFSGTKYRAEWLEAWLQSADPVRTLQYGILRAPIETDKPHPKLGAAEAKRMAAFLLGLKDSQPPPAVAGKEPPKPAEQLTLYTDRCECRGCHRIWSDEIGWQGGASGPVLSGVGKRANPEWIKAFLQDPRRFEPLGRMPNLSHRYRADPEFNYQKDGDLDDLVRTVAAFPAGDETDKARTPRDSIDPKRNEIPAGGSEIQQTFWRYCAQCHGTDALGKGPNAEKGMTFLPWREPANLRESTRGLDYIRGIIQGGGRIQGVPAFMPSWSNTFDKATLEALANLAFGFRKNPPPAPVGIRPGSEGTPGATWGSGMQPVRKGDGEKERTGPETDGDRGPRE